MNTAPDGTARFCYTGNQVGHDSIDAYAGHATGTRPRTAGEPGDTATVTWTGSQTLTVTLAGSGQGTVASTPAGIFCGSDCSDPFAENSQVTLTAAADGASRFTGWSGDAACSGTGECTVTMDQARSVTATFEPQPLEAHAGDNQVVTDGAEVTFDGSGSLPSSRHRQLLVGLR